METNSDYRENPKIRKAIFDAMPYVPPEYCEASKDMLYKTAWQFYERFLKEVDVYDDSGRTKEYTPIIWPKQRTNEIEGLLCKNIGISALQYKYAIYQVYFIVGVLMSFPAVSHTWWEETFAKNIWEYLGWTNMFKNSEDNKKDAIADIESILQEKPKEVAPRYKSRNIYVASSWRNRYYDDVVKTLQEAGHNVYDFRHPGQDATGFRWTDVDEECADWTPIEFKNRLTHPLAEKQFRNDFKAMQACDICVLVLPCGKSAHTEAGWFAGQGKKVYAYIPDKDFEPELMYKLFTKVCLSLGELLQYLS